jgi:hypothetical protein
MICPVVRDRDVNIGGTVSPEYSAKSRGYPLTPYTVLKLGLSYEIHKIM